MSEQTESALELDLLHVEALELNNRYDAAYTSMSFALQYSGQMTIAVEISDRLKQVYNTLALGARAETKRQVEAYATLRAIEDAPQLVRTSVRSGSSGTHPYTFGGIQVQLNEQGGMPSWTPPQPNDR